MKVRQSQRKTVDHVPLNSCVTFQTQNQEFRICEKTVKDCASLNRDVSLVEETLRLRCDTSDIKKSPVLTLTQTVDRVLFKHLCGFQLRFELNIVRNSCNSDTNFKGNKNLEAFSNHTGVSKEHDRQSASELRGVPVSFFCCFAT